MGALACGVGDWNCCNSIYFPMADLSYLGSSLILTSIVGHLHGFNLKTYAASTWLASQNFRVVKRKIRKIEKRTPPPATPPTNLYTFTEQLFF